MAPVTHVPLRLTSVPENARTKFCDTLDIDHENQLLYAADNWSGGVDVFDISTPVANYVKTIRIRGSLYGIAVAQNIRRVFVGLSGSTVAVIHLDSNESDVTYIDTVGQSHTDLLDYDPGQKKVYAANHTDGVLVSIDAEREVVTGRIVGLGNGLEQPRSNPGDGMVYLTDNRANVLYQLDPIKKRLVNTFEIPDECYPNGLAISPSANCALLACNNKQRPHTVIWDLGEQKIDTVIEETGCGDGAIYDSTIDRFFFAASGFSEGPVMGIFGGNPVRFLANVPTAPGASWVAFDRRNALVYAPALHEGKPALISFPIPDSAS
jgi:DNA-binding beta-propeller fold protein YncE